MLEYSGVLRLWSLCLLSPSSCVSKGRASRTRALKASMCFCWTSGRKGKPRRDTMVLTGRILMGAECRLGARCGAYWPCVSVTPDDVTLQIRQTLNPLSLEVRIHMYSSRSSAAWVVGASAVPGYCLETARLDIDARFVGEVAPRQAKTSSLKFSPAQTKWTAVPLLRRGVCFCACSTVPAKKMSWAVFACV